MDASSGHDELTAREVYCRVVEEADVEQQRLLVEKLCGGRPEVKRRVKRLLDARDQANNGLLARVVGAWQSAETDAKDGSPSSTQAASWLDSARSLSLPSTHPRLLGKQFGPYQLLEVLGEGGMGTVYRAKQLAPLEREVALKVIKSEPDTPQAIARFAQERQSMALMEHPNIASIFDGGETADGNHYLVMELIRGVPLDEYCRTSNLSIEQRLGLFMDLGRAIQHAHSKNIIHRDLKPSNILVASIDDKPIVKVIDFGIAKSFGRAIGLEPEKTQTGQLLGTPLYQSPEQLDAEQDAVDLRSDVYSLGVVLYKLLTDATPVAHEVMTKVGFDGLMRILREQAYAPPATRARSLVDAQNGNMLAQATASLPKRGQRDLDWITLRALQPEVENRYPTVAAMLEDLSRFLSGEPILAGPPRRFGRLRNWIRQQRVGISVAATLIAVLAGGSYLATKFGDSPEPISPTTDLPTLSDSAARWRETSQLQLALTAFRESDYASLRVALAGVNATRLQDSVSTDSAAPTGTENPNFRLKQLLYNAAYPKPLLELADSDGFQAADYSPQSGRLIVATKTGEIRLYSLRNGAFTNPTIVGSHPGRIDAIAISPDGSQAVSGTDSLWFWNLDDAKLELKGEWLDAGIECIVWSPDGQTVAAGARYEATWVGDRGGNELFRVPNDHRHETLLFSPDSKSLFIPTRDGVDEYEVAGGRRLRTIDVKPLLNIRTMSLAGRNQEYLIVADRFEETASVINLMSGVTVGSVPLAGRYPQCFRVTNDGKWLAAIYPDGKCSLMLLRETGRGINVGRKLMFQSFNSRPLLDEDRLDLVWIEEANQFLTFGGRHASKLWEWNGVDPVQVKGPPMQLWDVLPGAGDELIFFPNDSRNIGHRAYFVAIAGKSKQPLGDRLSKPTGIFSKSSKNQLVASLGEISVDIVDLRSGKILARLECQGSTEECSISLSEDGSAVVVANAEQVRVWTTENRWESWIVNEAIDLVTGALVRVTDGGETLLIGAGSLVQEIDLQTGGIVTQFDDMRSSAPKDLAIDGERGRVVVGKRDSISVFERPSGKLLHRFQVDSEVTCLLLTSDPSTLLSGHRNGTIRAWHLGTLQPLGILFQPAQRIGQIRRLEVFPDQNRILAIGRNVNEISPIIIGNGPS